MSTERIDDPVVPSGEAVEPAAEAGLAAGRGGRLEEEGDVAVRNGRTYISVVSEEGDDAALQALVGRDGEVLEALQELTRLSVLTATESRSRLVLDITGYRTERGEQLQAIAEDAVKRAKEAGQSVALAPMSAYERKIVHDAVADLGLVSESEGEGADRHIVVSLPAS